MTRTVRPSFIDHLLRTAISTSAGLAIGTLVVAFWPGVEATVSLLGVSASLGLLTFGGIQIYTQRVQAAERQSAARGELEGPAWLARRYCDAAVQSAESVQLPSEWASRTAFQRQPVEVETKFLSVLRLASAAGGRDAKSDAPRSIPSWLLLTVSAKWHTCHRMEWTREEVSPIPPTR